MLDTRRSRVTFSAVLALVAMGAGLVLWAAEQRRTSLARAERAESTGIDDLVRASADLDAILRHASAIDHRNERWVALVDAQIRQVDAATARLRTGALPTVIGALTELQAATRALEQSIGQVGQKRPPASFPAAVAPGVPDEPREQPQPPLAAADPQSETTAQFGPFENVGAEPAGPDAIGLPGNPSPTSNANDARALLDMTALGLAMPVSRVRAAHARAFAEARAVLADRSLSAIGAAAVAWAIGLSILTWLPGRGQRPPSLDQTEAASLVVTESVAPKAPPLPSGASVVFDAPLHPPLADAAPALRTEALPSAPAVDLGLTARVCRDLANLTSAAQLPALLGGVANAVGARGVVLWTCADAGLIAAAVHGYDAKTVRRFGAIPIEDQSPVAVAWRTGAPAVVSETDTAPAALAVPVLGVREAIAVLAMELRRGRTADSATVSVASIFAAQLAAVVDAPRESSGPRATADDVSGPIAATSSDSRALSPAIGA
jgi:hypothetical protein